jgi:hypothetical protein
MWQRRHASGDLRQQATIRRQIHSGNEGTVPEMRKHSYLSMTARPDEKTGNPSRPQRHIYG